MLKKLWVLPIDIRLSAHANKLRFRPRSYSYIGAVPVLAIFDKPIADWDVVMKWLFDKVIGGLFRHVMTAFPFAFEAVPACKIAVEVHDELYAQCLIHAVQFIDIGEKLPLLFFSVLHKKSGLSQGLSVFFGQVDIRQSAGYLLRQFDDCCVLCRIEDYVSGILSGIYP